MTDTNALGLPLVGEKPEFNRRSRSNQLPLEDLKPMIEAVFTHDDVVAVRWHQYTPYFNDGDVCEFGVSAGGGYGFVQLESLGEDYENEEDGSSFVDSSDEVIKGGHKQVYMRRDSLPSDADPARIEDPGYTRNYVYYRVTDEPLPTHPAYHDLEKLERAVNSGSFEEALYTTFGDHVTVNVYRDKIELERYEHD